ncbi:MAG: efflux RND transporter periplasmic adaptor subunit [Candidatus Omnitrophica bacterium]|nr:efflux RND transporter periplasmic adaptor subunit [Candidatus Omnitrophota bacterium]
MRINKTLFIFFIVGIITIAGLYLSRQRNTQQSIQIIEVQPKIESIEKSFSATADVLPRTRLEIKPPVAGRLEEILVKEGDLVTQGQIVAWMSSTERAALLDAAQGQGQEKLEYWKKVYKAIPLITAISGQVIVSKMQPGQTVSTSDAVIVVSDRLIVRAQVDETDIGKVKVGQKAIIELDAFAGQKINGVVDHIYYESKTINNVTVYEVDIIPQEIPDFFRSGMNATVYFITAYKDNVITIPEEALIEVGSTNYVWVKTNAVAEPVQREIKIGIRNGEKAEVVSGLSVQDTVLIKTKKYTLPLRDTAKNPFLPQRRPPTVTPTKQQKQ